MKQKELWKVVVNYQSMKSNVWIDKTHPFAAEVLVDDLNVVPNKTF